MDNRPNLVLPSSYEDLIKELGASFEAMTRFVVPVEEAEKELALITQFIKYSGRIVFLLGAPGIGKSTFIRSLTWSSPLSILEIQEINANELSFSGKKLDLLYQEMFRLVTKRQKDKPGLYTVVVNYLEDFSGQNEEDVRAFFRDVNGLLRNNAILVIWPVTQRKEVEKMVEYASHVSGTVFADKAILEFQGPPIERFPKIAQNTIAALNPNSNLDDFQLSDDDFTETLDQLRQRGASKWLIRDYLATIRNVWIERSGAIKIALSQIPKPTEVWFVVCYPEAENVVSQFTSRSTETETAWSSNVGKFSEYISGTTQRATDWDQRRLNLAMRGYFNTKVMFMPTHALLSCVTAFGTQKETNEYGRERQIVSQKLLNDIAANFKNERWKRKSQAISFLNTSPLVYLLKGQGAKYGSRRGASSPAKNVEPAFTKLNQFVASGGEGSDRPINSCLALGLRETLEWDESKIIAEAPHPWLDNIRPDLMALNDPNKIVCIEMHYTNDRRPYVIADYVLKKMDRYMKEIQNRINKPRLL